MEVYRKDTKEILWEENDSNDKHRGCMQALQT